MTRTPLPTRRPSVTVTTEWQGRPLAIGIGFNTDGQPREVFVTGPREGSDLAHLLADLCVVISVALQHGIPATALSKSLGRVPVLATDLAAQGDPETHASVAGLILAAIAAEAL